MGRNFNQLRMTIPKALFTGLGFLGVISSTAGCDAIKTVFDDPLQSKDPDVIKGLSGPDRYIHDYLNEDNEVGDDCLRGTDFALTTTIDGKAVPVAQFEEIKENNVVTGYRVIPSDNPKTNRPVEKAHLVFAVESTGTIPLQPINIDGQTQTAAKLEAYGCSLTY